MLFQYKAATPAGHTEQGELDAKDLAAAIERLQAQGFIPIRVTPAAARPVGTFTWPRRATRLSSDALGHLTRELATLLNAGLALDRALDILINLAASDTARTLLTRIRDDVRGGAALSAALEAHPAVFSRFYVSMIKAGEAGGALDLVLARIGEFMERAKELRDTVTSALIYPAILVIASVVSVLLLLIFVVPQFAQMFEESGQALPLPTQIVIGAGQFIQHDWWALVLAVLLAQRVFAHQMQAPRTRLVWDRRFLRWPLVGDLVAKVEIAKFARTLSTLVANGIPLLPALTIVHDTVGNRVIAAGLEEVREKLKEGHGLGRPLMAQGLFPKMAVHMILVGEETGQLDAMLAKIADVYDREVQLAVKRMLALLEPVMILGLGLVIGGIILSILLAILKVNSLVG